jgi:hypothetical protein
MIVMIEMLVWVLHQPLQISHSTTSKDGRDVGQAPKMVT